MTKQVRWKCPICECGVLASSRPRKDDVRRYCLTCSAETGRLVERVSPALERQREVKRETRQTAAKRKRATQARKNAPKRALAKVRTERQRTLSDGTPVMAEAKRIWKILEPYHHGRPMPKIVVSTRGLMIDHDGRVRQRASGYAGLSYGGAIMVKSFAGWGTLAHELAHEVDSGNRRNGRRPHDEHFYKIVRFIFEKRWRMTISNYGITSWGYNVDAHYGAQISDKIATAWVKRERVPKSSD